MNKLTSGLLALLLMNLVWAGCSDSDPEPASPARPTSSSTTRETASGIPKKAAGETSEGSLVDLLPANTLFSLHFPDLGRTRQAMNHTHLYDIFMEEAVQRLLALPADKAIQLTEEVKESTGIDAKALLDGIRGEAILGVTMAGMEPGVFAALDLGSSYLEVHTLVRKLGKNKLRFEKKSGLDVFTFRMGRARPDLELCFHQGRLLVAMGEDVLKNAIRGPTTPLSESPGYRKSVAASFGPDADTRIYLNLEAMCKLAMLGPGSDSRKVFEELGLDRVVSLVMATTVDGQEFHDRIALLTRGKNPVLSRLFANNKKNDEVLNLIPGNTESFFTGRIRLGWIPAFARALVKKADPGKTPFVEKFLGRMNTELGLPVEEFLTALGEEVAFMQLPSPAGASLETLMKNPFAGGIYVFRMQDSRKVAGALDHLGRNTRQMRKNRICGLPGYSLHIPGDIPLRPCLVLEEDLLMISGDPLTMERYLERGASDSIEKSPLFELRWREMPGSICGMSYVDFRPAVARCLEGIQEMLPMISAAVDRSGSLPFDMVQLPDPAVIKRHVTPLTAYLQISDDGLVMECVSPIGSLVMGIPIMAIGAAVAVPNMMKATGKHSDEAGSFRESMPGFMKLFGGRRADPGNQNRGGLGFGRTARRSLQAGKDNDRKLQNPRNNENATLYFLRSLVQAQEMLRKSAAIDVDQDRVGEFGTLAELAGAVPIRGGENMMEPPILTPSCGNISMGILVRSGYCLRLYLPGKNGKPLGEKNTGGAPAGVDPGLAETTWCLLAWPRTILSGTRSFYVDQKGRIFQSDHPYRGMKKAPSPEGLLEKKGDLSSGMSITGLATDGSRWKPVQ